MRTTIPIPKKAQKPVAAVVFSLAVGMFIFLAGSELLRELNEVLFYKPVQAEVVAFEPAPEEEEGNSSHGTITYRYALDGKIYTADFPSKAGVQMPRAHHPILDSALKPGDGLTAYYNPRDPVASTLAPAVEPFVIAVLIFLMPFILLCAWLWRNIFTRRDSMGLEPVGSSGAKVIGGSVQFAAYFVISAIAGLGLGFASKSLPWQWGTAIGVLVLLVVAPGVAWFGSSAIAARLRTIKRSNRHSPWGRFALALAFTIFWCGVTALVLVFAIGSLAGKVWVKNQPRPEEAWVLLLFLVPFIVSGLYLAKYTVTLAGRTRRLQAFLACEPRPPLAIPTWGALAETSEGISIQAERHTMPGFAAIFTVSAFLGVGGAALGLQFPAIAPWVAGTGFTVLVVLLASATVTEIRRPRAVVVIDPKGQRLAIRSPLRNVELVFADIKDWAVWRMENPRVFRLLGASGTVPVLGVRTVGRQNKPIHIFSDDEDAQAIAARTAEVFAALTGKQVAYPKTVLERVEGWQNNPVEMIRYTLEIRRLRKKYCDLL
jgi:hypothetical protein